MARRVLFAGAKINVQFAIVDENDNDVLDVREWAYGLNRLTALECVHDEVREQMERLTLEVAKDGCKLG